MGTRFTCEAKRLKYKNEEGVGGDQSHDYIHTISKQSRSAVRKAQVPAKPRSRGSQDSRRDGVALLRFGFSWAGLGLSLRDVDLDTCMCNVGTTVPSPRAGDVWLLKDQVLWLQDASCL